MTAEIGPNRYGKSAIRLVRVDRAGPAHRVRDLTVAIALEGDFAASYVDGDNSLVVATDTMKNTAYALAAEHLTGSIEAYATELGRHFLREEQVTTATVTVSELAWRPIGSAPDAFSRDHSSARTCVVAVSRDRVDVDAGIADLVVMKTSKSAFSGFPRDEFTTLAETEDRLLATKVSAVWRYVEGAAVDYDASFEAVSGTMLDVFAEHHSVSVQASIWIIGKAIVERHPEVAEVTMTLPNLHHWTADIERFGIPNDRQIYVSTTEPHGLIQATVRRS
jgi:urate oxidase